MRPIDADALKDNLIATLAVYRRNAKYDKTLVPYKRVIGIISSAPTIDAVSVVHGEWLDEHEDGHGFWVGTCSQCGKARRIDNFCPNCGAKMDGERKGERVDETRTCERSCRTQANIFSDRAM